MWRVLFASLLLLPVLAGEARAQASEPAKVEARLIAESGEIAPGKTVTVALEENITPGWHTYWANPGDAGEPSDVQWTLPAGWKAGAIQWPYPKRLPVGPLMNYGYEDKVWLLVDITAPADAQPGAVTLNAHASWLVCKEVCIPEDATLSLPMTVSNTPQAPYATIAEQFAAARAKLPAASPWPAHYRKGETLDLYLAAPRLAAAQPAAAAFFPYTNDLLNGPAPQKMALTKDGIGLRMVPGTKLSGALGGVLVLTSADGSVSALSVNATPGPVPDLQFDKTGNEIGITAALLFALLGGLILNLMPCVLPILAMKALAVASKAGAHRSEAAREGLAYGAGAVLSFVALGAAVVALRASGQAVGWGFQLQEPIAVAGFALLIFAVGLNLSGVFEIAGGITGGDALTRKGGAVGAFFTGVLAVAVAAPCTAPFMAAALGFALTQTTALALLVFLALGVGFAAPFVAIGLLPALSRALPKPGRWMLHFRQALAFPMYGAAAWLVWVLAQESGSQGLLAILAAMVALAFAAWAWGASRHAHPRWKMIGALCAVLGLAAALASLPFAGSGAPQAAVTAGAIPSEPFTQARLTELRAQNRPVFINATAAWCITCQVNERVAFSGARVRDAFAKKHVAYLIADWTNRNPQITALLEAHGRAGVPLYLYFAPGGSDAIVLPQILTEDDVVKAVGG